MKRALLVTVAATAALVAGGTGASASTLPRCPRGAVITIVAGRRPACNLDGTNQLNVRYPGSDGIERAKFRRMCADAGCARLVWFIPGGHVDRGQWMFIDVDK